MVWLILYIVLGWGEQEVKYKPIKRVEGIPKVTMVASDSEVNIIQAENRTEVEKNGTEVKQNGTEDEQNGTEDEQS